MGTSSTQRHNRRVERYLQQIQSSKDNKVPTSWSDFIDTVIIGKNINLLPHDLGGCVGVLKKI